MYPCTTVIIFVASFGLNFDFILAMDVNISSVNQLNLKKQKKYKINLNFKNQKYS